MREHAVEAVRGRRAGWTAGRVAGSEHEVVDEELRAVVEQLGEGACAADGVEAVLVLERHPRKLAALLRKRVGELRVLLLPDEQRLACGEPVLPCSDPVLHARSLLCLSEVWRLVHRPARSRSRLLL